MSKTFFTLSSSLWLPCRPPCCRLAIKTTGIQEFLGFPYADPSNRADSSEVAKDQFAEATVGCCDPDVGAVLQSLFDRPTFRVNVPTGACSDEDAAFF